ncbi:MAG: alpha/beta fold hydrolase [Anaerolineales bacterium]|nr:alpha/beta fold hydrolase [Anaerolineales bacterium]
MATYLLCHGGWVGGWQWREVKALLQAAGHTVFTPTFTGHGERVHLAHPGIDMHTYIQDVVNVLRYEDLHEVILLGYSLSGPVISGVAEQMPERIRHLVFLDTYLLADGQAMADQIDPELMRDLLAAAEAYGDGWRLPHDPPDAERRTEQPVKPVLTPLSLANPQAATIPRTFILCTQGDQDIGRLHTAIGQAAARVRSDPDWRYHELATGHMPMWTRPRELADLLLALA